jgi:hypothetical protein
MVEVGVLVALLAARGALTAAPLRAVFLAVKLPFCWGALRRRPGAYLALWLWEFAAVGAALATSGALVPRGAVALLATTVMVLLGRAVRAFPTVEFRPR